MNYHKRIARLMKRVAELEQSAEKAFYDNPTKRSVRNLAESKAISNRIDTVENVIETGCVKKDISLLESETILAPPPPEEIVKKPGGKELSTLNQFVVQTEEHIEGVPQSYEDTPRAEAPLEKPTPREVKQDLIKKVVERHVKKNEAIEAVREVLKDRV